METRLDQYTYRKNASPLPIIRTIVAQNGGHKDVVVSHWIQPPLLIDMLIEILSVSGRESCTVSAMPSCQLLVQKLH